MQNNIDIKNESILKETIFSENRMIYISGNVKASCYSGKILDDIEAELLLIKKENKELEKRLSLLEDKIQFYMNAVDELEKKKNFINI